MHTIKYMLLTALFFSSHLTLFGALSEKELKQFKRDVEMAGVRTDTHKDEDRKKFELFGVNTFQNEDSPEIYDMSRFQLRMVVELTDKEKNTWLVQFTGRAPTDYDTEYLGEDYWGLYMAHGDFERLKISAYIVQYGIMDDETFIPLVEEESRSEDMLARVRERTTRIFPGKVYLRHYYVYDDPGSGTTESTPTNIKLVKE